MTSESPRIRFLVQRDGTAKAQAWVERTLVIYRAAVDNSNSHASLPHYRPLFEASIRCFEA